MFGYDLIFAEPWYLALLLLLPLLWWAGLKSLVGLGRVRAVLALAARSLILLLLVLALAEAQLRRTTERLAVLYLLDQSLSIPEMQRQRMFEYVERAIAEHRRSDRGDLAGVIVFGRRAVVELPPVEHNPDWISRGEALPAGYADATNLQDALSLALAGFPEDAARRAVLVTDGNENVGDARRMAAQLAAQGIGLDVVPIRLSRLNDIALERIVLPAAVKQGDVIEARVVVNSELLPSEENPTGVVQGRLRITRRIGAHTETLADEVVDVAPGKNVFPLTHSVDEEPGFFSYQATIVPLDPAHDAVPQNNRATGFTHVAGRGRVLLVENAEEPGTGRVLAERLRANDLLVRVAGSDQAFATLADLQNYDAVILCDVPRVSGESAGVEFTDTQVEALVRNTEMGAGLVMLGGPNSFGAGGWAGSPLEQAMPVDFQIKNLKVVPSGALMLVFDRSGSMSGEKIVLARRAAREAVKVLSSKDHVGLVAFDSTAQWIVPMQLARDREAINRQIDSLASGGGTDVYVGMEAGYRSLRQVDAAVKHMIVLTDGLTPPANFQRLVRQMRNENITVSGVAVGQDADGRLMADIASWGGGNYYHVIDPRGIPRIFIKEAMRVAQPLVFEREQGFSPQRHDPHEILRGIADPLPPIRGFVMTTVKQNPLVEVPLLAPEPVNPENAGILATWTYGAGRSVAFTTDVAGRWTDQWAEWSDFDPLFSQMIRWALRPQQDDGKFLVAADPRDEAVRIVLTALEEEDQFLDPVGILASVVAPDLSMQAVEIEQTAPGRYLGRFAPSGPGSYFLSITPGAGRSPLRVGVNVPYSAEFLDRETNWPLLEYLAEQQPAGGEAGRLIDGDWGDSLEDLLAVDTFRHNLAKARSMRDVWPLMAWLAGCLFLADVFVRRVSINLGPLWRLLARRSRPEQAADTRMTRLRSLKQDVSQQIDRRRATARFERTPQETEAGRGLPMEEPAITDSSGQPAEHADRQSPNEEEPGYTARLLEVKKRSRQAQDRTADRWKK